MSEIEVYLPTGLRFARVNAATSAGPDTIQTAENQYGSHFQTIEPAAPGHANVIFTLFI
ncbi:hypothetical protein [Taibaiella chishuiensis]|uniref:hypothetical protein n=1 Tax=Taibaiella chishuiensis TaxID=1434707 RepID=UPI0015E6B485|nr:hypothetical protein [Taibaiella chishuiensis]